MTVHFDFTVSDVDAENIIDIMRSAIARNNEKMATAIANGDNESVLFLKRDTAYIESLIEQMKTTDDNNYVDRSDFDYCEFGPSKRHSDSWYDGYTCQHCGCSNKD